MSFTPHGRNLIAGNWIKGAQTFKSEPASGPPHDFALGTAEEIDVAAVAAEKAFWSFGYSSPLARAEFLDAIADEIEARADEITAIGVQETGLAAARLEGERGRTTGQLRLFANYIRSGDHLDYRHEPALPDRAPFPRPDLKLMQRPVGPVAVFGASNFPLAFSTAGGDTAAALAAGCPVVVKGHAAHPGTGEIIALAIHSAIQKCDLDPGVFSLIQGASQEIGSALVQHPLIKAVGFTGSLAGGRALFDLCARRPEPIPFFGELGSINPVFILRNALAARGREIAEGWAASLTLGVGQFCTNPGVVILNAGKEADTFCKVVYAALRQVDAQVMLSDGIASAYLAGQNRAASVGGMQGLLPSDSDQRYAKPQLFRIKAKNWLENDALAEEIFGPLGMIVEVDSWEQAIEVAHNLQGQLTCTIHMEADDHDDAAKLLPILERKAGRLLANGFPTGVEVSHAMVHGGPYPASTNFGATSVGTMAIRRFLRPVCYQNLPADLLPEGGSETPFN